MMAYSNPVDIDDQLLNLFEINLVVFELNPNRALPLFAFNCKVKKNIVECSIVISDEFMLLSNFSLKFFSFFPYLLSLAEIC